MNGIKDIHGIIKKSISGIEGFDRKGCLELDLKYWRGKLVFGLGQSKIEISLKRRGCEKKYRDFLVFLEDLCLKNLLVRVFGLGFL